MWSNIESHYKLWLNFLTHPRHWLSEKEKLHWEGGRIFSARDDERANEYMESMDGGKKEKIRIQGHKIKSLSHSLAHRPNNISVHDFHMCSCSPRRGEIKSGVESEAWDEWERKRKEQKPSSGCFIMIIYFFFFLLLFLTLFSLFILCCAEMLPCWLLRKNLAMFHTKVIWDLNRNWFFVLWILNHLWFHEPNHYMCVCFLGGQTKNLLTRGKFSTLSLSIQSFIIYRLFFLFITNMSRN